MITIRAASERGKAQRDWLDSRHSFSFGSYHDPEHRGFLSLRVINEDKIAPGGGFPTHAHQDMEIVTYVLEGALEHKDSLGNGSTIRPGDLQRMSAGTGIRHSEYNASSQMPVHLLQIWLLPESHGIEPSYEQKHFAPETMQGQLKLIGSRDGRDRSITIHQDVSLYGAKLREGEAVEHALAPQRSAWIQVARGSIGLNGKTLQAGDGAAIAPASHLAIVGQSADTELLLFDLAA